ncbi:MAG: alanine dehydrogenase [Flavobacteriales bacterium]|nr:alanine dehydrogenase [Flavobacteriales bacterium]MCB9446909.1 alanine dehydrogenase [Flavobacteriales bacterium]
MSRSSDTMRAIAQFGLLPQEEMLEVATRNSQLNIGIPKEISADENRIALVPEAVSLLVNNGHSVIIESEAGKFANYHDRDYSEAGAQIVYDTKEVYEKSNIIMKVAPPSEVEIGYLQPKQCLISTLQLAVQPKDFLSKLIERKVTALAYESIMDEDGIFPVIRSMSEIAGNTSISIAAEYLSNVNKGQGMMMGGISGIPPTEVVILGAGTVGEFAARSALGLGASVKVFDNSIYKLRRLQNDLGIRIYTSILRPNILAQVLRKADVVVGAIRATEGRAPCVITEEMVSEMKVGSVIIDVSIDHGGCSETSKVTTHADPVYREYGVVHYCVPNIASRVSKTASQALSNIFAPILLQVGNNGGIDQILRRNKGVRNGVYLYNGILTSKYLGETFHLPYKNLDLLVAAF